MERSIRPQSLRNQTDLVLAETKEAERAPGDRGRKDEALVVVRVLADEVHAAGRRSENLRLPRELFAPKLPGGFEVQRVKGYLTVNPADLLGWMIRPDGIGLLMRSWVLAAARTWLPSLSVGVADP